MKSGRSSSGEHRDQGEIVETTVMQKRADGLGFWAYDASGQLLDRIRKEPRDMLIPTRCTGCPLWGSDRT